MTVELEELDLESAIPLLEHSLPVIAALVAARVAWMISKIGVAKLVAAIKWVAKERPIDPAVKAIVDSMTKEPEKWIKTPGAEHEFINKGSKVAVRCHHDLAYVSDDVCSTTPSGSYIADKILDLPVGSRETRALRAVCAKMAAEKEREAREAGSKKVAEMLANPVQAVSVQKAEEGGDQKKRIDDLERQLSRSEEENRSQRATIQKLESDNDLLRKTHNDLCAKRDALAAENKELTIRVAKFQAEKDRQDKAIKDAAGYINKYAGILTYNPASEIMLPSDWSTVKVSGSRPTPKPVPAQQAIPPQGGSGTAAPQAPASVNVPEKKEEPKNEKKLTAKKNPDGFWVGDDENGRPREFCDHCVICKPMCEKFGVAWKGKA